MSGTIDSATSRQNEATRAAAGCRSMSESRAAGVKRLTVRVAP
jgi:hypothetical protein